jgi:hypothetical protein
MVKSIPPELVSHILPFNWNVRNVWSLPTPAQQIKRSELDYLLDLKLWSSVPKAGMLFDISPRSVIANPAHFPHQYQRVQRADISFPIDMMDYRGQRWILDGVHRLAKLYLMHSEWVALRLHSEAIIDEIRTD